jgi:hypothetical protein
MKTTPTPEALLSPRWSFVVQLREGTALTPEALHGRIEHIVSGQATLFTSLEALRAFMAQVLTLRGMAPAATISWRTAVALVPACPGVLTPLICG